MNFPGSFWHAQVVNSSCSLLLLTHCPLTLILTLLIIVGFSGAFLIVIAYSDGLSSDGCDMTLINQYWHISWNFHAGIAIVIWSLVRVLLGISILLIDTSLKLLTLCLQFTLGFKSLSTFKKISSSLQNSFCINLLRWKHPLDTLCIFLFPDVLLGFFPPSILLPVCLSGYP